MPYCSVIVFQFLHVCHPSISSVILSIMFFIVMFAFLSAISLRLNNSFFVLSLSLSTFYPRIIPPSWSFLSRPLSNFTNYPPWLLFSLEVFYIFSPTLAVRSPVSAVSHESNGDNQFYTLSEQKLETPTQIGGRGLKAISSVCGGLTCCTQGLGGVYWSSNQALDALGHRVQSVGRWYFAGWLFCLVSSPQWNQLYCDRIFFRPWTFLNCSLHEQENTPASTRHSVCRVLCSSWQIRR